MSITVQQIRQWRTDIGRGRAGQVLEQMRDRLEEMPPGAVNELLSLSARFSELARQERLGVIGGSSATIQRNQIVLSLLDLLRELEEEAKESPEDLIPEFLPPKAPAEGDAGAEMPSPPASAPAPGPEKDGGAERNASEGAILYRIPRRMQLESETRCIVRLAFDEATVRRGLEDDPAAQVKGIRVAEVMTVELIDPNGEPAFAIRAVTDTEQFLEAGAFTEWIFQVRPLRAGTFPLLLKVSVILRIQGRERRKNIVLEETVDVSASAPAADPASGSFHSFDPGLDDERAGRGLYLSWSGSAKDAALKTELEKHLSVLRDRLYLWDRTLVPPGLAREETIRREMSRADLFAVLLSADYLASAECREELDAIQRRRGAAETALLPILIRRCRYESLPIGRLLVLPRNGKAVAEYPDTDSALTEITEEISKLLE